MKPKPCRACGALHQGEQTEEKRTMKRIVIQVSEKTATNLNVLAERYTDENRRREGYTSHGAQTVSKLLTKDECNCVGERIQKSGDE